MTTSQPGSCSDLMQYPKYNSGSISHCPSKHLTLDFHLGQKVILLPRRRSVIGDRSCGMIDPIFHLHQSFVTGAYTLDTSLPLFCLYKQAALLCEQLGDILLCWLPAVGTLSHKVFFWVILTIFAELVTWGKRREVVVREAGRAAWGCSGNRAAVRRGAVVAEWSQADHSWLTRGETDRSGVREVAEGIA
jgi:hypothetical protein